MSVEVMATPDEVGSTRDVHMMGGLVGHEELIAFKHGTRMAFRFNAGRCRVEWTMAMDIGRKPGGLGEKVSGPILGFMLARMLKKFGKCAVAALTNLSIVTCSEFEIQPQIGREGRLSGAERNR